MKADIDQNGKLTITPETGVEAYALKNWLATWDGKKLTDRPIFAIVEFPAPPKATDAGQG